MIYTPTLQRRLRVIRRRRAASTAWSAARAGGWLLGFGALFAFSGALLVSLH